MGGELKDEAAEVRRKAMVERQEKEKNREEKKMELI